MSKRLLGIIFILLYVLSGSYPTQAQSNEGALAGTVVDPTGNSVAGATVTATNSGTGQTFRSVTTSDGQFRYPVLTIGDYNVSVTATGFKTAQRNAVAVQIQSTTSLDISLAI